MSGMVYLCGPITGTSYEGCTSWREEFVGMVDSTIECLSPMRHKEYLSQETSMADSYDQHIMSSIRAITTRDRFDTLRCDMLVSNLLGADRVSIGSVLEIAWADSKRTPIVLVMEEGNIHDHGMVRECAGWIVPTLEEAAFVVNKVLVT